MHVIGLGFKIEFRAQGFMLTGHKYPRSVRSLLYLDPAHPKPKTLNSKGRGLGSKGLWVGELRSTCRLTGQDDAHT